MRDPCLLRAESTGCTPKYWTGEMNGTWPVYVRDKSKAAMLPKANVERTAAEFNRKMSMVTWTAEPVTLN